MITEAQRRALFALREALHLCEVAEVSVSADLTKPRVHVICCDPTHKTFRTGTHTAGALLESSFVDTLLAEHPE